MTTARPGTLARVPTTLDYTELDERAVTGLARTEKYAPNPERGQVSREVYASGFWGEPGQDSFDFALHAMAARLGLVGQGTVGARLPPVGWRPDGPQQLVILFYLEIEHVHAEGLQAIKTGAVTAQRIATINAGLQAYRDFNAYHHYTGPTVVLTTPERVEAYATRGGLADRCWVIDAQVILEIARDQLDAYDDYYTQISHREDPATAIRDALRSRQLLLSQLLVRLNPAGGRPWQPEDEH